MKAPFFKGFVVGLLVGGVAALLLAPSKGPKDLTPLCDRFREAIEVGRQKAGSEHDRLTSHYQEMVRLPDEKQE